LRKTPFLREVEMLLSTIPSCKPSRIESKIVQTALARMRCEEGDFSDQQFENICKDARTINISARSDG
jgi:hypothetical protein